MTDTRCLLADSADSQQQRYGRRRFVAGMLAGIALVVLARVIVEETTLVDWFVTPLLESNTAASADVIVVLGAGTTDFCTPNPGGLQRVLLATELYHQRRAPLLLFTGGRPTGLACTTAEALSTMAQRLGVDREHIRTEDTSRSTWQNALRSDAILRVLGARRILLVTDRLHMPRAEASFRRFGYQIERAGVPVPLGHSSNTNLFLMGMREYAALAYYRMRGYTSSTPAEAALVEPLSPNERTGRETLMESHIRRDRSPASVVILGASYAAAWNPAVEGAAIVNKGLAGQQSFEMLARFEADVVQQQPRAVIVWGFINDIFRAPRPEIAATLARVRESHQAMIAAARRHGIEPILATEVTMGSRAGWSEAIPELIGRVLGKQSYQDYVNRHVMDTNTWLRELARREGILLLDLEQVLATSGSGLRRSAYTAPDGSHITPAAYDALSAYAAPILSRHLSVR